MASSPPVKPHVFLNQPLPPELQHLRDGPFTLHLGEGRPPALQPAARAEVRALITSGARGASRELIEYFPRLEIIGCLGVGVDAIDFDCARERNVRVINTPGVIVDDVADLAMAMILERLRCLREANAFVTRGEWPTGTFPLARTASGRRLGIIGLGGIGKAIAARAAACRMHVAWHGPRPKPEVDLPWVRDPVELARNVDVLVAACSGGPATHHLVDARVLEALGPQGILVNVSRGSVVDTAALVAALERGALGGAALDVLEGQPHVPGTLRNSPRVFLTPHVGSATHETRRRMGDVVVEGLLEHFAGRVPATLVHPR